jgi:hypothetical protein
VSRAEKDPTRPIRISSHAASEIQRRGLDAAELESTLAEPEQVLPVRDGRVVLQRRFPKSEPTHLVRIFIDNSEEPAVVVTAYRTSKIEKYWSKP